MIELLDQPAPDQWYNQYFLTLDVPNPAMTFADLTGVTRDSGIPVSLAGTITGTKCDTTPAQVCSGELRDVKLLSSSVPVADSIPGDATAPLEPLAFTPFLFPSSWRETPTSADTWTIASDSAPIVMTLRELAKRVVFDGPATLTSQYPDAHVIANLSQSLPPVWIVERGYGNDRQTIVGYDNGSNTFELTFDWNQDPSWVVAGEAAIRMFGTDLAASVASK